MPSNHDPKNGQFASSGGSSSKSKAGPPTFHSNALGKKVTIPGAEAQEPEQQKTFYSGALNKGVTIPGKDSEPAYAGRTLEMNKGGSLPADAAPASCGTWPGRTL